MYVYLFCACMYLEPSEESLNVMSVGLSSLERTPNSIALDGKQIKAGLKSVIVRHSLSNAPDV